MRGRDHPHIGLDRLVTADAIKLAVGEHAQQARLQFRRHVADFIEEQRAALGLLEAAAAHRLGAGESAALVTEQFRFEQVPRHRRGVDRDKGFRCTAGVAMQRQRHQFLAGARLTGNQHGGVGLRQPADGAKYLLHRGCLPEDFR